MPASRQQTRYLRLLKTHQEHAILFYSLFVFYSIIQDRISVNFRPCEDGNTALIRHTSDPCGQVRAQGAGPRSFEAWRQPQNQEQGMKVQNYRHHNNY